MQPLKYVSGVVTAILQFTYMTSPFCVGVKPLGSHMKGRT